MRKGLTVYSLINNAERRILALDRDSAMAFAHIQMTAEKVTALVAKSLRSRAMMANALCTLAEQELQTGQDGRAVETIRTLRGVLNDISLILGGDVSSIPISDLREVQGLLAGLDQRIAAVEDAIGPETVH